MIERKWLVWLLFFGACMQLCAQGDSRPDRREKAAADIAVAYGKPVMEHRLGVEVRPAYILPTNEFYRGCNRDMRRITNSLAGAVKYDFRFDRESVASRLYGRPYQGVAVGYFGTEDAPEIGNPFGFYLFQGAELGRLSERLTVNYEWNLGLTFGWKPYDSPDGSLSSGSNPYNKAIGSRCNAYIGAQFYLDWAVNDRLDLQLGLCASHFSNGNTKIPNSGMNTAGIKVAAMYTLASREKGGRSAGEGSPVLLPPPFLRHWSYDLTLFGSWRRKGMEAYGGGKVLASGAFPVVGLSFAPMYNFGYRFRAGAALDLTYDGSANLVERDYIVPLASATRSSDEEGNYCSAPFGQRLGAGLSARAEYVMPYCAVQVGIGHNVLGSGDWRHWYQILALKLEMSRCTYLHIGYNLGDFRNPNFLMLGVGVRLGVRTPKLY